MINNRRGVSAVVANVLIILLVVVGVALIWAAVRPSIEKGAQGVQADCFTIQLEPTTCALTGGTCYDTAVTPAVSTTQPASGGCWKDADCTGNSGADTCVLTHVSGGTVGTNANGVLTIKRNPGEGTLGGLKLVYEDGNGNSVATVDATAVGGGVFVAPQVLSSSDYQGDLSGVTEKPARVNIAMQVGSANNLCNVVHQPVTC